MSPWWRIVLLIGLAALLSGCYVINPEPQDDLLASPKYEMQVGASYCENNWPFVVKSGPLHIHSSFSCNTGPKTYWRDDLDHVGAPWPRQIVDQSTTDFLGFADHGEKLPPWEWAELQYLGQRQLSRQPVVLPGFEWTIGAFNDDYCTHVAVYGSSEIAGAWVEEPSKSVMKIGYSQEWAGTLCPELADLYSWLETRDEQWVGCFAHPWAGTFQFGNFHLPTNHDKVRAGMALIEIDGGYLSPIANEMARGEQYYQRALAARFWVAPVHGVDNLGDVPEGYHGQNVVWCRNDGEFGSDDLLEAFRGRRTFVRRGKIDEIRFAGKPLAAPEYTPIGQALECVSDGVIEWQFLIRHELVGMTVDLVSVCDDGSTRLFSLNPNNLPGHGRSGTEAVTVRQTPADDVICTYLRIRQGDSAIRAVSAPIWINRVEKQPPQDVFETLGFNQLNADPYCAEVATHNLSNLKPTYDVRYEPGQEFGAVVEVDSRYPVVFLVTERDDRTRTVFCRGFANRGEQALWMHKNTTAETEYLSVYVLYKDQPDSWAGHVQLRPNYFSPHEQIYEFDDDLTHRDVTLYYREKP